MAIYSVLPKPDQSLCNTRVAKHNVNVSILSLDPQRIIMIPPKTSCNTTQTLGIIRQTIDHATQYNRHHAIREQGGSEGAGVGGWYGSRVIETSIA